MRRYKKTQSILAASLACVLLMTGCSASGEKGKDADVKDSGEKGQEKESVVHMTTTPVVYLSKGDEYSMVYQGSEGIEVMDFAAEAPYTIVVDPTKMNQEIEGFGASFTDSSAHVMQKLSKEQLEEVMETIFSPDKGANFSYMRQPMSATDYATEYYSYDEMKKGEEDYDLEHFSIDYDRKEIIPLFKLAQKYQPNLKVMGSPWTPPQWMRTEEYFGGSKGGELRRDVYDAYAKYFVKFIQEYGKEGIKIDSVTVQNEPGVDLDYSPTMPISTEEQSKFISDYLKPALDEAGLDTEIYCLDDSWGEYKKGQQILAETQEDVAGIAFHWYAGDAKEALTSMQKYYPNEKIFVTESSGDMYGSYGAKWKRRMVSLMNSFRYGSSAYMAWNFALDEKNGPMLFQDYSHCIGTITVDTKDNNKVYYAPDFYAMAHFSKFLKPKAHQIESTDTGDKVMNVAFKNPDGSVVLVAYNQLHEDVPLTIQCGDKTVTYTLPARATATLVWDTEETK